MDQEKTNIPYILSKLKALAGSYVLDTHITSTKIYGRGSKMYVNHQQFLFLVVAVVTTLATALAKLVAN